MAASLSLGEFAVAGRIAAEAWTFWKLRGHVAEGLRWLGSVLDHAETLEPGLHTDVLVGAGDLAIDTGDLGSAAQHLEAARALADERNDLSDAAAAVAKLASLPHKAGDIEGAISMGEQALAIAQEAGDDWVTGRILPSLALLHEDQGDHERAAELSREAVTVGRRSANPYLMADAALSAGEIALNSDDLANAQRLFEEAEASAESAGLGDVRAWALAYLGKLAVVKSEYRRARALLEQALSDFRELEAPMGASWALCHLGRALLGEGDPAAAKHRLEEGLDLATVYVRPDVPIALESLGIVAAEAGDPERAAVLLGAAEAIRDSIGLTLAAREQRESTEARDAIRGELGSQQAAELLDQGRSMSIDDAAAFVLKR